MCSSWKKITSCYSLLFFFNRTTTLPYMLWKFAIFLPLQASKPVDNQFPWISLIKFKKSSSQNKKCSNIPFVAPNRQMLCITCIGIFAEGNLHGSATSFMGNVGKRSNNNPKMLFLDAGRSWDVGCAPLPATARAIKRIWIFHIFLLCFRGDEGEATKALWPWLYVGVYVCNDS